MVIEAINKIIYKEIMHFFQKQYNVLNTHKHTYRGDNQNFSGICSYMEDCQGEKLIEKFHVISAI